MLKLTKNVQNTCNNMEEIAVAPGSCCCCCCCCFTVAVNGNASSSISLVSANGN